MRRTLALALALPTLLAADVATALLAPAGATWGQAHAADFTGRIKRIRIKKKRASNDFKVVVVSDVEGGDAATAAAVVLTDPSTGRVLAEGNATTTTSSKTGKWSEPVPVSGESVNSEHNEGSLRLGEGGLEAILNVDTHAHGALAFDPVTLQPDAAGDSPWVEVAHDSGLKARVRMRGFAVGAQVHSEDGTWLPLDAHGMTATLSDGTRSLWVELTEGRVQQRFVLDTGALDVASIRVAAQVEVGDGDSLVVGDDGTLQLPTGLGTMQTTDTVALPGSDAAADQIQRVRLAETNRGGTRLVVFTSTGDAAGSAIEGQVIDPATGAYALDTLDESPAKRVRLLENGQVDFDAELADLPGALGGSTYLLLADMYDSSGNPVGNQQEFEVSVDGLEARSAGGWQDGQTVGSFASSDGLLEGYVVWQADAGIGLSVAYGGTEDVRSVDLTFEEPFDGPTPMDTTVTLPVVLEANKWVTRTRAPVPANATVGVTLVDAEGTVLDAITTSNASTGRVYENDATNKYGDILIDGVPLIFD